MRAWLLELGRPSHHVSRFQTIAPMSAAATIACVRGRVVDEAGADRLRDGRPGERADEVERGGHRDGVRRAGALGWRRRSRWRSRCRGSR